MPGRLRRRSRIRTAGRLAIRNEMGCAKTRCVGAASMRGASRAIVTTRKSGEATAALFPQGAPAVQWLAFCGFGAAAADGSNRTRITLVAFLPRTVRTSTGGRRLRTRQLPMVA